MKESLLNLESLKFIKKSLDTFTHLKDLVPIKANFLLLGTPTQHKWSFLGIENINGTLFLIKHDFYVKVP